MSGKFDEEQRKLLEKRELLKLKQGLVEESEILEEKPVEKVELHGWKKVENFFYHYKWRVIVITLVVLLVGFMTMQSVMKERNDLYVLLVSTENKSGIYTKVDDIETTLEKYCPDFDNNGYVHVGVNFLNLSYEAGITQYTDIEKMKLSAEVTVGDGQMILADEGIIQVFEDMGGEDLRYFILLANEYSDITMCEGQGLQINKTAFVEDARWSTCPDNVGIFVRDEVEDMMGNDDNAKEQRRRATIVMENIASGNVVNPTVDKE